MMYTVIGMFDSDYDANNAIDALMDEGVARKFIDVGHKRKPDTITKEEIEKNENAITSFFKSIFGDKDENADRYTHVAKEMASVVTVYSEDEMQAERIADILDDHGAIDVSEKLTQYGNTKNVDFGDVDSPAANRSEYRYTSPNSTQSRTEPNADIEAFEDPDDVSNRETTSGPGVSSVPTSGKQSKSRIIPYKGEASARLREDRDNEVRFW